MDVYKESCSLFRSSPFFPCLDRWPKLISLTQRSWTGSINAWPNGGEIDIVEGVNLQTNDEVVLHTGKKCSMASDNDKMTGTPGMPDYDNANGCTVKDKNSNSYGEGLNKGRGGVYAMEWTSKSIKIWWWGRNSIPEDVRNGTPSPQGWQVPLASFDDSGCDIDKMFKDHQIVRSEPA